MEQALVDQSSQADAPLRLRLARAVDAFFFTPASARPLGALRIGLAAVLLAQAWMLRTEILDFFTHDGIVQGEIARYFSASGAPHLAWLVRRLSPLGVSEASCLYAVCGGYFASLVALAAGLHTRLAAVLAWFLHWTLLNTGYMTSYGLDQYAHISILLGLHLFGLIMCVLTVALFGFSAEPREPSPSPSTRSRPYAARRSGLAGASMGSIDGAG